ncbi:hypothetical protein SPRG_20547 [Saprolegnia parasitica CBS 223.65]|uniref:Uncharacterized protein n=1 Tax=Saprolegnia parasitica (strain CBS 223.65) TaxID=695850 RepID=A0A067CC68_SAPPC|nr:hypothetical protein SPRG_20547 [Saprolegnia parasitica CBS 223.65]KDO26750.1 hypothetical protein SPRG_20547 [Saprolegnia parasitica CBS 223.65]|eukprot:XP_012202629.1 hypothetical protein SPRG_20547 [Saprolegnia parasitica CBS 223.65]
MTNPISNMINSFMASRERMAAEEHDLLQAAHTSAKNRLQEEEVWRRSNTAHQAGKYTSPEGYPDVPRQYVKPSHSTERDYATYPANSLSAFIAITDILGEREL